MAYVPVPKDLNAVKTKVLFNLTKRQLICFGGGAAINLCRKITTGNADVLLCGAHGFYDQFHHFVDLVVVVREVRQKNVILDVFLDDLPVQIHISVFRFSSLRIERS